MEVLSDLPILQMARLGPMARLVQVEAFIDDPKEKDVPWRIQTSTSQWH